MTNPANEARTFKTCSVCSSNLDPEAHECDGEWVETIHGEKVQVMRVEVVIVKKNGVPTGEIEKRILARSGDQLRKDVVGNVTESVEGKPMLTWFPFEKIK